VEIPSGAKAQVDFVDLDVRAKARTLQSLEIDSGCEVDVGRALIQDADLIENVQLIGCSLRGLKQRWQPAN
jgi:hypothetical protein